MVIFEILDSFALPGTGQIILSTASPEFDRLTPNEIERACHRLVLIKPNGTKTIVYPTQIETAPSLVDTRNVHFTLPLGYTDETEFLGTKVLGLENGER